MQTAHWKTSAAATAASIKGHFTNGQNVLRTRATGIYFMMRRRGGAFYQTAFDSGRSRSRTERFDLVLGSGRKGQSYLYWRNGVLFELPISYLTSPDEWINSPGYLDGRINFDRVVVPRCLECHSTTFKIEIERGAARYSSDYVLGISCSKCHGPGERHGQYQASHPREVTGTLILNPAAFSRGRKMDNCGLCHSGPRKLKQQPFSYRPGDTLDDYLVPPPAGRDTPEPDVHGDQFGLLQRSKCFRSSPDLTCSTCHDVHRTERDVTRLASKCLSCHQVDRHKMLAQIGTRMTSLCVDCHMPNQESNAIQINTPAKQFAPYYRSHRIAIYPETAAALLKPTQQK